MAGVRWTDEDILFLKDNYINMTCAEIAEKIGRTTRSVQHMFGILGLERPQPEVGDIVGNFEILEKYTENKYGQNRTMARCKCVCGNETIQKLTKIVQKPDSSCGCIKAAKASDRCKERNYKHGDCGTSLYNIWVGMNSRCKYRSMGAIYDAYGGSGIFVCDEWVDDYVAFKTWAIDNGYKEGLTIDRIDNSKGYSRENCRWVTMKEQNNNKKNNRLLTVFNETKTAQMWSEDPRCPGVSSGMICWRQSHGWSDDESVLIPTKYGQKYH